MKIDREAHRRIDELTEQVAALQERIGQSSMERRSRSLVFTYFSDVLPRPPASLTATIESLQDDLDRLTAYLGVRKQSAATRPARYVKVKKEKTK